MPKSPPLGQPRTRPSRINPLSSPHHFHSLCSIRLQIASNGIPSSFIPLPLKSHGCKIPWPFHQHLFNRCIHFPKIQLHDTFVASDGLFIITYHGKLVFKEAFGEKIWRKTLPNLTFSRFNSQIGLYYEPDCSKSARFIVAGGNTQGIISSPGNIMYSLEVEIYNPDCNVWETCPPLPENFRVGIGSSSKRLCSIIHKGKFYVLNVDFGFLSYFDLKSGCWSAVQTVKPPDLQTLCMYLVSCEDHLILGGFFFHPLGNDPEFSLWKIDEETLKLIFNFYLF